MAETRRRRTVFKLGTAPYFSVNFKRDLRSELWRHTLVKAYVEKYKTRDSPLFFGRWEVGGGKWEVGDRIKKGDI